MRMFPFQQILLKRRYFTIPEKVIDSTIWDDTLFYALSPTNVYVSEDGGANWFQYPLPITNLSEVSLFLATGPNELVLMPPASEKNMKVFVSVDRGKTWHFNELDGKRLLDFKVKNGVYGILLYPAHPFSSQVNHVKFYRSDNSGLNWNVNYTFLDDSTKNKTPDYLYFHTTSEIYASGGSHVYKTTDGGLTWNGYLQSYPYINTAVFYVDSSAIYASKLYRRHWYNSFPAFMDGMYVTSTDNGQTWSKLTTSMRNIHVVYSDTEIVGSKSTAYGYGASVFSSFTGEIIRFKEPEFLYERKVTFESTDGWYVCYAHMTTFPGEL